MVAQQTILLNDLPDVQVSRRCIYYCKDKQLCIQDTYKHLKVRIDFYNAFWSCRGKLNGNLIEKFRILDHCGFDRIKRWLAKICAYYTLIIIIIVVACTSTHSLFSPKRLSIKFVTKTKLFIEYSQFHFGLKKKIISA